MNPMLLSLVLTGGLVVSLLTNHARALDETKSKLPPNRLLSHPSPYLNMHGKDPINWQSWGTEALDFARRNKKLLFVSVGYFACHWCHVMQRESFQDKTIAAFINENFVPVKVDRELNPALDAGLIEFVQRTRGHAGWPLNVILTPEGYPVLGAVYLPRDNFFSLLRQMKMLWTQDHEFMAGMARQAADELEQLRREMSRPEVKASKQAPGQLSPEQLRELFFQSAMAIADDMVGGFGDKGKFPMVPQLQMMLAFHQQNPREEIGEFLTLTLDQMATQGLRDHLGGGFFRYTVDPNWQVPHFEKMLYDNAMMAGLYLKAADVLQRDDYRGLAQETLNFILREMRHKEGGFVSSLSAVDDRGVEGGYYLWPRQQLQQLVSETQYKILTTLWAGSSPPVFEAGLLPLQNLSMDEVAGRLQLPLAKVLQELSVAQLRLFKARQQRQLPMDHKRLAAWNGLALSSFVQAAELNPKYVQAAREIRQYLVTRLWDGERLWRAQDGARTKVAAGFDDYVYAARGLYQWGRYSGDAQDMALARTWAKQAWQRFFTEQGWLLSDELLLAYNFANPVIEDSPMVSPSAALIALSGIMHEHKPDDLLAKHRDRALALGAAPVRQQPFYYASQLGLLSGISMN